MKHFPFAPGVIECQRHSDNLAKRQQRRQQMCKVLRVLRIACLIAASISLGYVLTQLIAKVFA